MKKIILQSVYVLFSKINGNGNLFQHIFVSFLSTHYLYNDENAKFYLLILNFSRLCIVCDLIQRKLSTVYILSHASVTTDKVYSTIQDNSGSLLLPIVSKTLSLLCRR